MKLIDLHNHSSYSRDAVDSPQALAQNAVNVGLSVLGFTDHNYWFMGRFDEYFNEIAKLKEEYSPRLKILCGMEIALLNRHPDLKPSMLDKFDYCIFEGVGNDDAMSFMDFLEYRKQYKCRAGLAHTDIFGLEKKYGIDILKLMKENDIFWELNVNYDRAHGYRTLKYYVDLMESDEQQKKVRNSGLELSVGFDTHLLLDYDIERVKVAHEFIEKARLKLVEI